MGTVQRFNRAVAVFIFGLHAASGMAAGDGPLPVTLGPSSFEQQGQVNRVDTVRSIVWIDGKPYKVTGATRWITDAASPLAASASLSSISAGDRVSFLAGEGGAIRALRFGSGIK